ncbi:hypothetical protein [Actinotalea solisilvae]|uniref:hypothetical protein n=1 Tax=Actinotalea solisilvae TaxID=2072922 RepID=UPI0018F1ED68|nr:hypothetical protein [Actinotalea solisilvae]
MSGYRVNQAGVTHARELIEKRRYDTTTSWSDAAPGADRENRWIERHGDDAYGEWHLAVDPDASPGTKARFRFPYGDFSRVNRAALVHAKQRAVQNGHDEVAAAADDLLQRLDRAHGD